MSGTQIGHGFNTAGALTLTNNATLNKTGAGTFTLGNGSGNVNFINAGTTNVNEGTLTYNTGSGSTSGIIVAASGAAYQVNGAALTLANGSSSTGNFALASGSVSPVGTVSMEKLTQTGGTLGGTGTLTLTGTGSTWSGSGTSFGVAMGLSALPTVRTHALRHRRW
ncbi:MAG: hypothetical protein IPJ25_07870 [Rhodocyclaceae bacterium]|nr:hypothetical protein [Rhodocyclaceae bacterium]